MSTSLWKRLRRCHSYCNGNVIPNLVDNRLAGIRVIVVLCVAFIIEHVPKFDLGVGFKHVGGAEFASVNVSIGNDYCSKRNKQNQSDNLGSVWPIECM